MNKSRFLAFFATSFLLGIMLPAANAQVPTPAERELRQKLIERLDALAAKLDAENANAESVVASLKASPPAATHSILKEAADRGSFVGKVVGEMAAFSADASTPAISDVTSHEVAIRAATDRAGTLSGYAQHVHALSQAAETEPLGQVLSSIEKAYVPDFARIVIAPHQGGMHGLPNELNPFAVVAGTQPESEDGLLPFIVGLGPTTIDFPAVAALLYKDRTTGGLSVFCTGTLVKPYVVLTAEHCINQATPAAVYFQHGGKYAVDDVVPFTPFNKFTFPYGDVALVFLKEMVVGITPIDLNDKKALPVNTAGSIVGYGYHSSNASARPGTADVTTLVKKTGIKVHAEITTSACSGQFANKKLICWTYGDRDHSTLSGSTCEGDSGGPLFLAGTQSTLAGTTSGGRTCLPGDSAVDTDIFYYASWVKDRIKNHKTPATLPTQAAIANLSPTVNDVGRFLEASSDRFFDDTHQWSTTFSVPTGLGAIRVAVNATASGSSLHLTVARDNTVVCDQSTDDTAAVCSLPMPNDGPWTLTVSGLPYQEYQVVATRF
jgi:Trypsin